MANEESAGRDVEIRLFPSGVGLESYDSQDEGRVVEAIRSQVLPQARAEYSSVHVKVKRTRDYGPDYLIAYMLRKDTYTADVVKIQLDEDFQVQAIEEDYDDSADYEEEEPETEDEQQYATEWGTVDFVAATPCPNIPTAKKAVEFLHKLAIRAGLNSKMLLGNDATIANYKGYLASGLKGFVNIGHGYPGGIVLWDGTLQAGWFNKLWTQPLIPAVVYFNSCQVFNPPLQPAVMYAGARTYVGGVVNLGIGSSEEVCKCFWHETLLTGKAMGSALVNCEKTHYPKTGAHAIAGHVGGFEIGRHVALRACNNRYVCAERGGGGELIANRDWIRSWETFRLLRLGGNKIALQSINGKYVSAEGGGGGEISASREWIRNWETFELVKKGGNRIALKASNGQYVCAEDAGAKPLAANRDWARTWETFELIERSWPRS